MESLQLLKTKLTKHQTNFDEPKTANGSDSSSVSLSPSPANVNPAVVPVTSITKRNNRISYHRMLSPQSYAPQYTQHSSSSLRLQSSSFETNDLISKTSRHAHDTDDKERLTKVNKLIQQRKPYTFVDEDPDVNGLVYDTVESELNPQLNQRSPSPSSYAPSSAEVAQIINKKLPSITWACQICSLECIPVRRESRCLCGHRLKEHEYNPGKDTFKCCAKVSSKTCACNHFFFLVAEGAWILKCRCKHKHIDHDCSKAPFRCKKCVSTNKSSSGSSSSTAPSSAAAGSVGYPSKPVNKTNYQTNTTDKTMDTFGSLPSSSSTTSSSSSMVTAAAMVGCAGFDSPWICNCGHSWSNHTQSTVLRSMAEQGAQLEDVYTANNCTNAVTAAATGTGTTKRSYAVRQDGLPTT